MAYELNAAQRQAIYEHGGNILVSAGAGSGKTTVLAKRVLAKICADTPQDIDRLLILTFTNAAAAEMRTRIEDNLGYQLMEKAGDTHLLRQLSLIQQAPITTIHSFCLDTIRNNFYHLPLDAGFSIPSDIERAILQEETIAAFLEQEYDKDDPLLAALSSFYGGQRDDLALARLIQKLYGFSRGQPHPESWLREKAHSFAAGNNLEDYAFSGFLQQELLQELSNAKHNLAAAQNLALNQDIPFAWLEQLKQEIADLQKIEATCGGLGDFCAALADIEFIALPRAPKTGDTAAKEEFRRLRDTGKKIATELRQNFGRRAPQDMLTDLQTLVPLMQRLVNLVIDYGAALDTEKRRRNLLDFEDMEHFCLRLLEESENGVAIALREKFEEILIDEYQDINAVQERILQLLSRGNNIFCVGDVKQSIYRFRQAEPALFLRKYQDYEQGKDGVRIDLNCNYRSNKGIILAVNYLFRQLMSMESCELDYDTAAELKAGQEDFGSACELWLIDRSQAALTEEDAAVELPKEASIVLEARLLGLRILSLQKEGYKLKDIAVLVRAAKNHENLLVREFAALGIAAISGSRPNYLQTAEISLVIALLSVIDNPLQELELATVLRSPLYDFSPDELTEIRHIAPKEQLYNAVTLMAERTEELAYKCRHFLEQLNGWRESLRRYRISELIDAIYRESGLFQLAGAWPFGEHRQQNLLFLKEQAREYEAGSYRGLFRFLLFLADGKKKDSMEGGEFADAEDVVHVMSIHRSKGLEFPVVIVANLGGAFALPDEKQDILWHKEFGLGPKMAEAETRRKFPSLAHVAIQRRLHKEAVAEEMRILYVALTRAREKLILSGIVKDIAKTALTWHQQVENQGAILSGALLLNEKNALDWLGQAILRHPHGAKLRQAAGLICGSAQEKQLIIPDDSAWQIKIIAENKLYNLPDLNATNEKDLDTAENLAFMNTTKQEVKAALSYQYPFRETCEAAAKWTVTELNRWQQQFAPATVLEAKTLAPLDNNQSVENIKPAGENTLNSLQAKPAKALRRGTAFHKLLQNLDFATAATKEELQQQLALLVEKEIILAEEAALIEMEKIISFTASQLGKRMAAAKRVIRETPFTYTLPATKLFPTAALKDKLILQGMIDAAFWEEDGWVLLDYKTGGLAYSEQQLKDIYTAQIAYYCQALRNIWQEPLKEAWLYFIDLQKTILVEDW